MGRGINQAPVCLILTTGVGVGPPPLSLLSAPAHPAHSYQAEWKGNGAADHTH